MKAISKVATKGYYSDEIIPAGKIGVIGADKVPCVRLREDCKCRTFVCVDYPNGLRASYHEHEIQRVADEVI